MFSCILYLIRELLKQPSEFSSRLEKWWMMSNSTVMTVAAILISRLLKMAAAKKNVNISVTKLKLEVRLSMQSQHRCTLLLV